MCNVHKPNALYMIPGLFYYLEVLSCLDFSNLFQFFFISEKVCKN